MTVEQQPVGYVLMMGIGGPGVPCGGKGKIRHIKAGENLHHAGNLLRLGGVHPFHHAVGNGGVDNPRDQSGTVAEIVGVFRPAGGLVKGVHTEHALTYGFAHTASSSCLFGLEKFRLEKQNFRKIQEIFIIISQSQPAV